MQDLEEHPELQDIDEEQVGRHSSLDRPSNTPRPPRGPDASQSSRETAGRWDGCPGRELAPQDPQSSALTKLRHSPSLVRSMFCERCPSRRGHSPTPSCTRSEWPSQTLLAVSHGDVRTVDDRGAPDVCRPPMPTVRAQSGVPFLSSWTNRSARWREIPHSSAISLGVSPSSRHTAMICSRRSCRAALATSSASWVS